ncbi:OTU domain-containing protein DDB_G0284757-like isoform X1 [Solanum tuberosum]|nr:PREDICTED: OTU domain-containing protein DDB_G0284757-like isoform X1 [Solanum tuberosum]XP_015169773.1 PREDICTED: OTU domain-containing protein DDB_G0284757-like isoform X1 [Solanum tuberosum]XP_015169774.1 PREDICTED: OTU domain-containing protein DDB_G0284757-like isoform X1 [Solanum tuberosum]
MTLYELDPDVVRWNLHLIDVCGINNGGSLGTVTQYDTDFSQLGYAREGYAEPMHINVENDEVIAHALQEELSRLSLDESIGSSHTDEEEHRKASVLAQDWAAPSTRFSNLAVDGIQEDTDSTGFCPLTVTSSNWESPEIEDESLLDGEVGKRLNQLDAIPHVPKINGDIPSVDEAKSDHQRLMDRLEVYDLVELKVSGDGNCQFRSLSDQIYRSTEHHKFVREQVVKQLKSHRELYEGYVPMVYDEYLKKMSKAGEWGDHVTLQAAADSYGVKMFVITSFKDTCYIEILPQSLKSNRIITLSFWAEVHYNSIYPQGEYPAGEIRTRKKWWQLG